MLPTDLKSLRALRRSEKFCPEGVMCCHFGARGDAASSFDPILPLQPRFFQPTFSTQFKWKRCGTCGELVPKPRWPLIVLSAAEPFHRDSLSSSNPSWGNFCGPRAEAYNRSVWQIVARPGSIRASCKTKLASITISLHRHSSHTLYMRNDMGKFGADGEWNMGKWAWYGNTPAHLPNYMYKPLARERAQSNVEECTLWVCV